MKQFFRKYYIDLFLNRRLFIAIGTCASLFVFSFFLSFMSDLPYFIFGAFVILILIDLALLYRNKRAVFLRRDIADRLSNGDDNEIKIYLKNFYSFEVIIGIIDEIPFQFQKRDLWFSTKIEPKSQKTISYLLGPTKRGEYNFGQTRLYVQSPLGLLSRRFNVGTDKMFQYIHRS